MGNQVVSLTGSDVIKLDGRIFNDVADGDVAHIVFPNDLAVMKPGKNGNTLVSFKNDGRLVEMTIRIMLGSSDDRYLNQRFAIFKQDPARFSMISGEFTKNVGDGQGNVRAVTYVLTAGVPTKPPEALENADGNTDQSMALWTLRFANGDRTIGN